MASRDFLCGFGKDGGAPAEGGSRRAGTGEPDEMELSLGLSLGGCFGTDPAEEARKLRLVRSSSIASICSLPDAATGAAAAAATRGAAATALQAPPSELMRTTSLPAEYMEDRLRRRAMQSQRRLAAKRKRLERRTSMNSGRSSAGAGTSGVAGRDDTNALEQTVPGGFQLRRAVVTQGSTASSLPDQGGSASGGADLKSPSAMNTSSDNTSGGGGGSGQTSSRPPAGSSAGARAPNGTAGAAREQQQPAPPPLRTLRSLTMRTASTGDLRTTMVEDMPMVSTKPEGPNGRKIEGFLYKYRKGEEVRIVCVCHGSFLTPAEFVRHAGGGDVPNPLRHIVVSPQQSVFL